MERQEFEEKIKVIKYVILSKLNLLSDYMNKQYGKCARGKWYNVEINYEDASDNED